MAEPKIPSQEDGGKTDYPGMSDSKEAGGSRKPTTKHVQSKDNKLEKESTSGGPNRGYAGGGKQGKFRQPY